MYFSDIVGLINIFFTFVKMLQSCKDEMGIFLLMKVAFRPTQGQGPLFRRATHVIKRLELEVPCTPSTPTCREGRGAVDGISQRSVTESIRTI